MPEDLGPLRRALESHREALLRCPQVVATGIGYKVTGGQTTGTLCIICSVTEKRDLSELGPGERVPRTVDGVPTDVVRSGPIHALESSTDRLRPAPGGVSIGHVDITAGTLGCLVRRGREVFILSNNHVLANSNDGRPGDAVLQPGPLDGGQPSNDRIAELAEFVPIAFVGAKSNCRAASRTVAVLNWVARLLGATTRFRAVAGQAIENLVDAALARPFREGDVSGEILEIGPIKGSARAELGLAVKKSGRTTGFTTGVIEQIDVTVDVQYGAGRVARFSDQLLAGPMSQGGDSGSAVLDEQDRLVGLLFAGSDSTTIFNRIEHVFSAFRVEL
ncbi:MAG: hypothetical protein V3T14_03055 [Myxococcota bacterium]